MIKEIQQRISGDGNLKELIFGSSITFVIKISGMILSYFVIFLVARKFGAEGTGVYSLTSNILNSLAIFGGLGLNIAVLRYVGQFNSSLNSRGNLIKLFSYIIQLALPFSIFVGVVLFILADDIAIKFFGNDIYISALQIGAIALPFFTLSLINVEFIRGLKMLKISEYLRSINRPLVVAIILIFSLLSYGLLNAVYAMLLGVLISFVFSLFFILKYFKKSKVNSQIKDISRLSILKTTLPMMITAVASFIMSNAGALYLEIYTSTDQVGIYNVCINIANAISLILIAVNTIAGPKIAELYWSKNFLALRKFLRQSTKIIFLFSTAIAMCVLIMSDTLLALFGEEFSQGRLTLIILVFGQITNAATGSVSLLLNMTGHEKILKNIILLTTVIVLFLFFLVIPKYGKEGAAFVNLVGLIILNCSAAFYSYKYLNLKTFYVPFSS